MMNTLQSMGLTSLFDKGVFKGGKNGSSLSEIIHKSIITVDEAGTEAAAATVLVLGDSLSAPKLERKKPYFTFKADRPFLFMLDDGVFVGVVNDPTKE